MTNSPELEAAVKAWRANDRDAAPMVALLPTEERREALRQIRSGKVPRLRKARIARRGRFM